MKQFFYVNREMNRQNLRYMNNENPNWLSPKKLEGACKLTVRVRIWGDRIIKLIFVSENLIA